MQYVLMVGPKLLCTDGMIFAGSKELLQMANIHLNEYIVINDHARERIKPFKEPTHIIVLGTPWLWDRCWESHKYANLLNLFQQYPNAKKLFLGIGSCFPLGQFAEISDSLVKNRDKWAPLFEGAKVIARDSLAADILQSVQLCCPAFYALNSTTPGSGDVDTIIWYDPTIGISNVSFGPESERLREYQQDFKKWYAAHPNAKVYCVQQEEIVGAVMIGLPRPEVISDIQHAFLILRNANKIISGRVHLAVPVAERKLVELVAVDSRAFTLYEPIMALRQLHSMDCIKDYMINLAEFIKTE